GEPDAGGGAERSAYAGAAPWGSSSVQRHGVGDRNQVAMRTAGWIGIAAVAVSAPAQAQSVPVDVAAGRAGDVAATLARQTGTSIVITDRALANRRVGAIKGRLSAGQAVERLARAAGARAVSAGTRAWRLVPVQAQGSVRRPADAPRRIPASVTGPIAETPATEIVVIGSKRDIALVDYAGQVEMVEGEQLVFGGVGGTEKIIQRLPTVSSTYLGSGRNKLFIRGI